LNKQGIITAISIMEHFPSEEISATIAGFIYDEDLDISIEAIQACAAIKESSSVNCLLEIVEKGKKLQKLEALRALSVIKAPNLEKELLKYYSVVTDPDVRGEIIDSLNKLCPGDSEVIELNRSILMDGGIDDKLKCSAVEGLTLGGDFSFLKNLILHTSSEVQSRIFQTISLSRIPGCSDFLCTLQGEEVYFSHHPLGYFLGAYILQVKSPNNNYVMNHLNKGGSETIKAFLDVICSGITGCSSVKHPFRILFLVPYSGQGNEDKILEILELIVEYTRQKTSGTPGELISLSSVYLDTIYKKIEKSYIRIRGIKDRDSLRRIILAHLLERYAPAPVCIRVGKFFKQGNPEDADKVVKLIRNLIPSTDRREVKRFEACIPLFSEQDRMKRLKIYSILKNMEPDSFNLLKRLNRVVRVCGILGIKSSSKRIGEILDFAHEEGLLELEPECITTFCGVGSKKALQKVHDLLVDPPAQKSLLLACLKGASYLYSRQAVKLLTDVLIKFKDQPEIQEGAIEALEKIDFDGFEELQLMLVDTLKVIDKIYVPRITEILVEYANSALFQSMLDMTALEESYLRLSAIRILGAVSSREKKIPHDVLTGKLYQLLEDSSEEVRVESLGALLRLGDDYALKVLKDWLESGDERIIKLILNRVVEHATPLVVEKITTLLESEDREIHEIIRKVLPGFCTDQTAGKLISSLIFYLGKIPISAGEKKQRGEDKKKERVSIIHHPKIEFKFKREHSQVLTVLFIDIAGYTERSIKSDMSSLMELLKIFEKIVNAGVQKFNGQIVKKLGDGMLCVFKNPISGVMAALGMQKEVDYHNKFSLEDEKFNVRIGLHTGNVIRREGDIFGEVVNIASRIQSSAGPGEILITNEMYQHVKELIICDYKDKMKLKGVEREIDAYIPVKPVKEAEEFLFLESVDKIPLSDVLNNDTLQKLKESLFIPRFIFPKECTDAEKFRLLQEMFSDMARACEQISTDYHEEYVFKKYLQDKWNELLTKYFED